MKKFFSATVAAVAIAGCIASASPSRADAGCPAGYYYEIMDGMCHVDPYGQQGPSGCNPYDPSGQGYLRCYGPDSSWQ